VRGYLFNVAEEITMTKLALKFGVVLALLLASGIAYADAPSSVLLRPAGNR